jgi:serine/threonine protein kinase
MKKPVPFGQYVLLEPIKAGGMSEIWRARPESGSSVVAIKRVLPQYAKDPDILGMFLDEARVAVQLSHPNIARVFDLGRVDDDLFLAMEYVPGSDLRAIFKRAAERGQLMPIPRAVHVIAKICDALDHAHRRTDGSGRPLQIVHRDVAPDNCLVTFDGEVKLIDFGVAKASTQSNKTRVGVLKGKLSYMSPEQVAGVGVDRRSDLFSWASSCSRWSPAAGCSGARARWPSWRRCAAPRWSRPAPSTQGAAALGEDHPQGAAEAPGAALRVGSEMGAALREVLAGLPPRPPRRTCASTCP